MSYICSGSIMCRWPCVPAPLWLIYVIVLFDQTWKNLKECFFSYHLCDILLSHPKSFHNVGSDRNSDLPRHALHLSSQQTGAFLCATACIRAEPSTQRIISRWFVCIFWFPHVWASSLHPLLLSWFRFHCLSKPPAFPPSAPGTQLVLCSRHTK